MSRARAPRKTQRQPRVCAAARPLQRAYGIRVAAAARVRVHGSAACQACEMLCAAAEARGVRCVAFTLRCACCVDCCYDDNYAVRDSDAATDAVLFERHTRLLRHTARDVQRFRERLLTRSRC